MPLLLAMSAGAWAGVPPPDANFVPSVTGYTGPGIFCLSGFSVELGRGERASLRQRAPWASEARIVLREGTLLVSETAGGYPAGQRVRRAGRGWLRKPRGAERNEYQYDDGLPGRTTIAVPAAKSGREAARLLGRISFVAPRSGVTQCIRGDRVP
ncbi:MAG: hypothetical protein LBV50_12345 [Novosphingobium sp.]|nr:hypothetical protein [Novosphingobium sp.]